MMILQLIMQTIKLFEVILKQGIEGKKIGIIKEMTSDGSKS